MRNTALSSTENNVNYSARREIEAFMRRFVDITKDNFKTSNSVDELKQEKIPLSDKDFHTALLIFDTIIAFVDTEKIRSAQRELEYQKEIDSLKKKLYKDAMDSLDRNCSGP